MSKNRKAGGVSYRVWEDSRVYYVRKSTGRPADALVTIDLWVEIDTPMDIRAPEKGGASLSPTWLELNVSLAFYFRTFL